MEATLMSAPVAFELYMARDRDAPRRAGARLRDRFGAALSALGELETATLVASDLVTNALRHGQDRITLRADLDEHRLLLEVVD